MCGVRLEAKVHIVTGAVTSAQNIVRSVNRAGLEVSDIVLEPLASSYAVLDADEKELGVALVDIGGGTADLAIFSHDSIKHTSVLAIGGNHLTNDIAIGLRTPQAEAESIKKEYGCASSSLVKKDETIEVPSTGGREGRILSRQILSEIIEPRVEEIFNMIKREMEISGFYDLISSGIVLTGGTSLMEGMTVVSERIFKLPTRIGFPKKVGGLVDVVKSTTFATGVGLVLYGNDFLKEGGNEKLTDRNLFEKIFKKMKSWMNDLIVF
jgi:cell division protein FtsA